ncbi:hypothetical protein APHDU1_1308 [Anaplasma phagocytophilum]|uniref:Uncharacterized protein n=1 Tax=Anaplasma phagocytophilum str. NCH-1 TaxID=1359161 RepID=A0A0F3MV33_ANAPH|nr:hypothetical protein EPHNCH_1638 [Anaplasma phagocytophilum str. NCH-1]KJV60749.1 hypothetical protein APHWEB_1521 [Anaplasma phagocytophilum str. Webster]KJV98967.1 hypothetical protein OTSANNIE_0758 [Anaplasma phagocytophilum str. Annie]KJZ98038.1 hypothetical protein APHDU1_1308 [Anaplasma phagocytophilum]
MTLLKNRVAQHYCVRKTLQALRYARKTAENIPECSILS